MRYIDTHAHLTDEKFATDLDAVLERSRSNCVDTVVCIGDNLKSSRRGVVLAKAHGGVWATAGVHPHNAKEWADSTASDLRPLLAEDRVVAVGEIGLDYHYDFSPREEQIQVFHDQLALAIEVDLPVVIHCRESASDILDALESSDFAALRGVVHCFTEDEATGKRILDQGLYLGIGGVITFNRSSDLRDVIRSFGLERVVLETDAPYLAPVPHRGKRNDPSFIPLVAAKIAEIVSLPVEKVAEITTRNACDLFGIA